MPSPSVLPAHQTSQFRQENELSLLVVVHTVGTEGSSQAPGVCQPWLFAVVLLPNVAIVWKKKYWWGPMQLSFTRCCVCGTLLLALKRCLPGLVICDPHCSLQLCSFFELDELFFELIRVTPGYMAAVKYLFLLSSCTDLGAIVQSILMVASCGDSRN